MSSDMSLDMSDDMCSLRCSALYFTRLISNSHPPYPTWQNCRFALDWNVWISSCSERIQTSDFPSATVLSRREFSSHRRRDATWQNSFIGSGLTVWFQIFIIRLTLTYAVNFCFINLAFFIYMLNCAVGILFTFTFGDCLRNLIGILLYR